MSANGIAVIFTTRGGRRSEAALAEPLGFKGSGLGRFMRQHSGWEIRTEKQKARMDYPKLREHLGAVVTIMQLNSDWHDFRTKLDRLTASPAQRNPTRVNQPESVLPRVCYPAASTKERRSPIFKNGFSLLILTPLAPASQEPSPTRECRLPTFQT